MAGEAEALSFVPLVGTDIASALSSIGVTTPTVPQSTAIGQITLGNDSLVVAQTGSGKTIMFIAPLLAKLVDERVDLKPHGSEASTHTHTHTHTHDDVSPPKRRKTVARGCSVAPKAFILAPTEELLRQHISVTRTILQYIKKEHQVACVFAQDLLDLSTDDHEHHERHTDTDADVSILFTTTSTLLRLVQTDRLDLNNVDTVVFDEVDACLCHPEGWKGGFTEPANGMLAALQATKRHRHGYKVQFIMLTAFLSKEHEKELYNRFPDLTMVQTNTNNNGMIMKTNAVLVPTLRQVFHYFNPAVCKKTDKLIRILRYAKQDAWVSGGSTMVFCCGIDGANEVASAINNNGDYGESIVLHGGLERTRRQQAVAAFRESSTAILVCTGVAARGLNFPHVRHVIVYDTGGDEASFVHTVGRTARRGEEGLVTCLVESSWGTTNQVRNVHQLQSGPKINFTKNHHCTL